MRFCFEEEITINIPLVLHHLRLPSHFLNLETSKVHLTKWCLLDEVASFDSQPFRLVKYERRKWLFLSLVFQLGKADFLLSTDFS